MKKSIDIEKLLQWAIRDELPKGQLVSASPWDIISQFGALGTVVQTSGYHGDGLGIVAGEPHDDALAVADAVKALERDAGFVDLPDVLALFGALEPIAGDAPGLLMMATFDPQSLVLSCATQGTRPKWSFPLPTPRQMFAPSITGRPRAIVNGLDRGEVVELKANRKTGKYPLGMSPRSPILWHEPSVLHVAECRAEWVTWHGALNRLAVGLAGKLKAFEVAPTTLPLMPWLTGSDRPRVIAGRDLSMAPGIDRALTPQRNIFAGPPVESPIEAQTAASYAKASREKMKKISAR
jgi:hypothetical protein